MKVIDKETGKQQIITLKGGVANAVKQIFLSQAPAPRSGKQRAEIYVEVFDGGFRVISPTYYTPYTTEKWISARWRGRPNPNEKWWDEAWDLSLKFLTSVYGKEFKREQ
jgi:hypothetical protein